MSFFVMVVVLRLPFLLTLLSVLLSLWPLRSFKLLLAPVLAC